MKISFIDLENSFVFFNPEKKNCWRTSIKSVLLDVKEDTYYYLTKECRAEIVGFKPFDHSSKSELCVVVNNKNKKFLIRNKPIFKFDEFGHHYYEIDKNSFDELNIKKSDYQFIRHDEIKNLLYNRTSKNFYTKFTYQYQNKEFVIFNKVEYINFEGKQNQDTRYLQPIYGYVPFLKDGKIYLSYIVQYLEKNKKGNLEFILRSNQKIKTLISNDTNVIKKILKKLITLYLFKIKISEFVEKISVKKSKVEFFIKLN
jgi:hypothetical protein